MPATFRQHAPDATPLAPGAVSASHAHHGRKHTGGLLLIGIYKLGQALLFLAVGIGALKLLHKDLGDVLLQTAIHLRFNTESRFITLLLEKVVLINDHRLIQISTGTFCYAALALVEGTGLMLEKTWAEYMTLVLGTAFLPWEFYELIRRVTAWRVGIAATNVLMVIYLIWFLRNKWRQDRAAHGEAGQPGTR